MIGREEQGVKAETALMVCVQWLLQRGTCRASSMVFGGGMEAFAFFVVAVAGFVVDAARHHGQGGRYDRVERAIRWSFGASGAWLLFAASGHLFAADDVARSIGWPVGSPFQREVGFGDLAWGVLGLLSVRASGPFRLAFALGSAIFLWGAAGGHIYEIVANDNVARNNSGLLLALDIGWPLLNLVLLTLLRRSIVQKESLKGMAVSGGIR